LIIFIKHKKLNKMKKQNQTCLLAGRKLSLNKKTISNLTATEMNAQVGGDKTKGNTCTVFTNSPRCTNTCYLSCGGGRCLPW
jgi:hypothetical protein